jgi:FAD/FMN-containing dehydrogenase
MSTAPTASPARDWDALATALAAALGAASRVRREEPLGRRTTLQVGGAARIFLEPADPAALAAALRLLRTAGVPFLPLGRGSNLLVPDAGVDGVVIALEGPAWSAFTPGGDGTVWTGAGLRLKQLCGLATKAGLAGFEFLEGIPGTVGGALRMNAGAMGGWMFDRVEEVELMSPEGEIARLPRAAFHVDYRHSAPACAPGRRRPRRPRTSPARSMFTGASARSRSPARPARAACSRTRPGIPRGA